MGTNSNDQMSEVEKALGLLQDDIINLKNSIISEGTITELEQINERVKEIESRVSGDSCSINHGEFVFTSVTEVESWLDRESVPSMGIFWDVFSALVAMAPKRLTGVPINSTHPIELILPLRKMIWRLLWRMRDLRLSMGTKTKILYHGRRASGIAKLMKNGSSIHSPSKL